MATLVNSTIEYESGQAQQAFAAMTDSGDHTTFALTAKPWSQAAGYEYRVVPYGLATGGIITPAAAGGTNNVDVSAMTLYAPGMTGADSTTGLISVGAATNVACTRGSSNGYRISSITVDSTGAVTAVAGTESTAFSETRAAAGGPPLIPVGSVEIGQVRLTSTSAAIIIASEIFQSPGTHQERYDYPVWVEDPVRGQVTFSAALPLSHTGSLPKSVRARVATPVFSVLGYTRDWKAAETSNSVQSTQYYDNKVLGGFTSSIGQAGFTVAFAGDGVTDAFIAKAGKNILFRYKPDKNKTAYQLTQGVVSIARTNTVGTNPTAAVTISAQQASVDFAS